MAQEDYTVDEEDLDGFRWKTLLNPKDSKCGALDAEGRMILPRIFYTITSDPGTYCGFYTQLADRSKGFYTRAGKCVIPHERGYDMIMLYHHINTVGYFFFVKKNGYKGVCDGMGKEIIKPDKYTFISFPIRGNDKQHIFFPVQKYGKHGICDVVGNEIIPAIYPEKLELTQDENRWAYHTEEGKLCYVDAQREPSAYNPFEENRVDIEKFYAACNGKDESVEELVAEAKALTKTLNDLTAQAQGTSGSSDAGKTRTVAVPDEGSSSTSDVMISEEEKENIRRKIRRQSMEEVEESLRRKDYIDAYNRSVTIVKDPDFYPKDAEEQCELATLFNEVKIGISSDMMVASAGLDFNRYMALSVVYMDIDGWQKKLLVSAISQGSQKAVLMLQLVNAANGGNSAAPNEPIDFNKDYKPSLIQVEEVCDYCHGTGTVRTQSVTNYGGNAGQFTDEICPSCGGTGKIKRLRNNPDL